MTWLKIPCVPEDIFFLLILRHEATMRRKAMREKNNLWSQELRVSFRREVPREKNNLRSQELQVSFPCNFRIISNRFGVDVHVCFHWRWQLRFDHTRLYLCDAWKENCAKAYLEIGTVINIVLIVVHYVILVGRLYR